MLIKTSFPPLMTLDGRYFARSQLKTRSLHKIGHDWGAGLLEQDTLAWLYGGISKPTLLRRITFVIRFFFARNL
jgi:hypothetical protein